MIQAGKPCPLCADRKGEAAPLQASTLAEFSGDEAPLQITLRGMPALRCAHGHTYFARPDFPLWLMQHLVEEDEAKLPAGDAKGLLFKRYACHDCGKDLAAKEDHRHSFHVPVTYPGIAPFSVGISMPVYRCTGCGKEQLHSLAELRKLTPAALVHAFKGAGIKAPG